MHKKKVRKKYFFFKIRMSESANSTILKLKTLKQKLGLAINEYENAYKNLQDSMKYAIEHPDPKYIKLNNRIFVGNQLREIKRVGSGEQCEALCKSIKECSGSTFFPNTSNCSVYTGNGGMITPTLAKNVAYVEDISHKTNLLAAIQEKITSLNREIASYDVSETTDTIYTEIDENQKVLMQQSVSSTTPPGPTENHIYSSYVDSIKTIQKNSIAYSFWFFLFVLTVILIIWLS